MGTPKQTYSVICSNLTAKVEKTFKCKKKKKIALKNEFVNKVITVY